MFGADGFGRSEARKELRRFFEVDAENIALAALVELAERRKISQGKTARRRSRRWDLIQTSQIRLTA